MRDIIEEGVTLVEKLEIERQPMKTVDAIYIMAPNVSISPSFPIYTNFHPLSLQLSLPASLPPSLSIYLPTYLPTYLLTSLDLWQEENIDRILLDFKDAKDAKYAAAHIYFTGPQPHRNPDLKHPSLPRIIQSSELNPQIQDPKISNPQAQSTLHRYPMAEKVPGDLLARLKTSPFFVSKVQTMR